MSEKLRVELALQLLSDIPEAKRYANGEDQCACVIVTGRFTTRKPSVDP